MSLDDTPYPPRGTRCSLSVWVTLMALGCGSSPSAVVGDAGRDAPSDVVVAPHDAPRDAASDATDAPSDANPCTPPLATGVCQFTFIPLMCFPQLSADASAPGPTVCTQLCPTSTTTQGSYCFVRSVSDGGPVGLDCISNMCNP